MLPTSLPGYCSLINIKPNKRLHFFWTQLIGISLVNTQFLESKYENLKRKLTRASHCKCAKLYLFHMTFDL